MSVEGTEKKTRNTPLGKEVRKEGCSQDRGAARGKGSYQLAHRGGKQRISSVLRKRKGKMVTSPIKQRGVEEKRKSPSAGKHLAGRNRLGQSLSIETGETVREGPAAKYLLVPQIIKGRRRKGHEKKHSVKRGTRIANKAFMSSQGKTKRGKEATRQIKRRGKGFRTCQNGKKKRPLPSQKLNAHPQRVVIRALNAGKNKRKACEERKRWLYKRGPVSTIALKDDHLLDGARGKRDGVLQESGNKEKTKNKGLGGTSKEKKGEKPLSYEKRGSISSEEGTNLDQTRPRTRVPEKVDMKKKKKVSYIY